MSVRHWVRFNHGGQPGFGRLEGGDIQVFEGELFSDPQPTSRVLRLDRVKLLRPFEPGKVIALYNNFRALLVKLEMSEPAEPLYVLKAPNSHLDPGEVIHKPDCDSRIVFEGELGIVIGRACKNVSEQDALSHVFGYTVANDVTAVDLLTRDPSFAQWTRAKGFDGFLPFGPALASGIDPDRLVLRTTLNGSLRQDYPMSDMLFGPARLVSRLSRDMSLNPGDMILCGTSLGVGVMKPGSTIEVEIDGIGKLSNRIE